MNEFDIIPPCSFPRDLKGVLGRVIVCSYLITTRFAFLRRIAPRHARFQPGMAAGFSWVHPASYRFPTSSPTFMLKVFAPERNRHDMTSLQYPFARQLPPILGPRHEACRRDPHSAPRPYGIFLRERVLASIDGRRIDAVHESPRRLPG